MTVTRELLKRFLDVHNTGVSSRGYADVVELFTDDGELRFVGVDLGPYQGHAQIAQAFIDYPPSDTLVLSSIAADGNKATAVYAFTGNPDKRIGTLVMTTQGDRIARLTISVQAR